MEIKIYQTLQDKKNPEEIISNGPFKCEREDAWLGHGYYFWENYEKYAHWWGKYGYKNSFVICSAEYEKNDLYCLNLVDNYDHLELMESIHKKLAKKTDKELYVPKIIEFLKKTKIFNFDAIRSPTLQAYSNSLVIKYISKNKSTLHLQPMIQVCFLNKTNRLNLKNYQIIYPVQYIEGYVV